MSYFNTDMNMAEESGGSSWWDGWGNDFLQNIKAKSSETMAMVKQDLSEFMCTVHGDTTGAIADTAIAVKDQLKVNEEDQDSTSGRLKQGMSDWFGTISTTLKDNISQVANTAAASFAEPDSAVFDRFQAHLNEIQTDPTTYCSEPDGHPRLYDEWCERFDLEQCKAEISELLVNKPKVRALYTNLVPTAVSHSLFWQRYFYKVHQLNQEEKRRAALVERANKVTEEDLGWGDEDDDSWGGNEEESSTENVVQLLTDHESSQKFASALHRDIVDGEKAQPNVSRTSDDGIENNGAESRGHDHVKEMIHVQETGDSCKDIVSERPSSTRDSKTNQVEERCDAGTTLENVAHGDVCGTIDEKSQSEKPVRAQRSDEGASWNASLNIITPTVEAERSTVLPSSDMDSLPECDAFELTKQSNQNAVHAESYEEAKVISPINEQASQATRDLSEDEKVTRDEAEQPTVNSQQSLHQRASSTGSVDSSWSKLSEEANDSKEIPSLSKSSSSSSGVLVPSVDDKDIEWENDLELDEDMSEEEMKKIIESLGNKDLGKLGDLELDDDEWDNWE